MLTYRTDGAIAYAMLDRPEKLNAVTRGFWAELTGVLERAERDAAVRVLIVHGAGRCFSVGGATEASGELPGAADKRANLREAMGSMQAVEPFTKPTIPSVPGHTVGG